MTNIISAEKLQSVLLFIRLNIENARIEEKVVISQCKRKWPY